VNENCPKSIPSTWSGKRREGKKARKSCKFLRERKKKPGTDSYILLVMTRKEGKFIPAGDRLTNERCHAKTKRRGRKNRSQAATADASIDQKEKKSGRGEKKKGEMVASKPKRNITGQLPYLRFFPQRKGRIAFGFIWGRERKAARVAGFRRPRQKKKREKDRAKKKRSPGTTTSRILKKKRGGEQLRRYGWSAGEEKRRRADLYK